MKIVTTSKIIKVYQHHSFDLKKLLKSLGEYEPSDHAISLDYILKTNGVNDAIWVLRLLDYKEYCLFFVDVAELLLPSFEVRYPKDSRPREAIKAIRAYHAEEISKEALKIATANVFDAAKTATVDGYYITAKVAWNITNIARVFEKDNFVNLNFHAISFPSTKIEQQELEELFIKHFCSD